MNKILILKAGGTQEPIELERQPTLKELQEWVGGYVEKVRVWPSFGKEMYANEDGRMKRLPMNAEASVMSGQPIVGNAVVLENFELE